MRIAIPIDGEGTDEVSNNAVARLHEEIVPTTVGAVAGGQRTGSRRPPE